MTGFFLTRVHSKLKLGMLSRPDQLSNLNLSVTLFIVVYDTIVIYYDAPRWASRRYPVGRSKTSSGEVSLSDYPESGHQKSQSNVGDFYFGEA